MPACPKAFSISSMAGAIVSMHCSPIPKCAPFPLSDRPRSRRHIYETGTRHGKRVQANGGAKNYIVVMPDADVPRTVEALATAAFGCAGERCMAGSTALAVGAAADHLLPSLVEAARAIKVGPTDVSAQPDMGPVITAQHRDRVLSLVASGEKEGAQIHLRRPPPSHRRCA